MRDRDSLILESLYHTILENNSMDAKYAELEKRAKDGDETAKEEAKQIIENYSNSKKYNLFAYHGSKEEFEEFKYQDTAYGYYFTPDYDTASYYGDNVFSVKLKMGKILDLTDDIVRGDFFKNQMSSGDKVRMKENEYGQMVEIENIDIFSLIGSEWDRSENLKKELLSNEELELRETDSSKDVVNQLDSIYVDLDDLLNSSPTLKQMVDEDFPEIDKDYLELENVYGSQDFYMNYQKDVFETAVANQYDSIIFDDPSSTGEPLSYVVFQSNQIKSADPFTYDDNGEIIPLSQRFDSSKDDIRF